MAQIEKKIRFGQQALRDEFAYCVGRCKRATVRSMLRFAEEEIRIPGGPFEGRRYRVDRQPLDKCWFDAVDSGEFREHWFLSGTQSGKTFKVSVIGAMYYLFERCFDVIYGVPSDDMAFMKWARDIKPAIMRSRYRGLIPKRGGGSQGGFPGYIEFTNGATLYFMGAGGGDEKRSGYTAPVLIMTEVDKFDTSRMTSREADPVSQMLARLDAYGDSGLVFAECTPSVEDGRIWTEYESGTRSKIVVCCHDCGAWVLPERRHLQGWQDAETEAQAERDSYFACPECGGAWTSDDRVRMMRECQMVSRTDEKVTNEKGHEKWEYQDIVDGVLTGARADTPKFSLRANAFNNLFVSPGWIGRREWQASRARNQDNAERRLKQFIWATPFKIEGLEVRPLSPAVLQRRMAATMKGICPAGTSVVTGGLDLHLHLGYYSFTAWDASGGSTVVDYGVFDIPSKEMGVESATLAALREFWNFFSEGFAVDGDSDLIRARAIFCDSGYSESQRSVYEWARDHAGTVFPSRGFSAKSTRYNHPRSVTKATRYVGEEYHLKWLEESLVLRADLNADFWKTWIHERLRVAPDRPGAMKIFRSPAKNEHLKFSQHMTAERPVKEWVDGKGVVERWIQESRSNHWLDCVAYAAAAGHYVGVRLEGAQSQRAEKGKGQSGPRKVLATEKDFDESGRFSKIDEHAAHSRL